MTQVVPFPVSAVRVVGAASTGVHGEALGGLELGLVEVDVGRVEVGQLEAHAEEQQGQDHAGKGGQDLQEPVEKLLYRSPYSPTTRSLELISCKKIYCINCIG